MKRLWWGVCALALVAAGCSGGGGGGTPSGGNGAGQLSLQNAVFTSTGFGATVVPVGFTGGQVAQVTGTIVDTQGGTPATFFVTPNGDGTFQVAGALTIVNGHTYQVNMQAFDATGAAIGTAFSQAFVANLTGSTGSTTATTGTTTATTTATTGTTTATTTATTGTTTATTTATTGTTTSGTVTGPPPPPTLPTT